jgi:predicted amidohydrolase YtcJ
MRKVLRFGLAFCAFGATLAGAQTVSQQKLDPSAHKTTYYLHAHIYTNDPKQPWAAAMAVRDEKIFCIGTLAHIMLDCGGAEAELDAIQMHEQFIMPGFNDAHTHLGNAGHDKLALDLKGTDSIEELQQRLRAAVAQHKAGDWIVGSGWDQTRWPEKRFPNRQDLDAAAPDNPVWLVHVSGHVGVANSMALKRTEILPDTKNPTGGEIERDADGNPTGLMKEGSAMEFVEQKIPEPTAEQRRHGIELVLQELAMNGVTSAQDNSAWDDFLVYRDLKEEKKLTVRITEWLPFMAPLDELQNMRSEGGTTDPWLKTGALKMVTDGALGSRTAAMLAPYSDDPNSTGILTIEPEKLKAMALDRDKLGFQLAFHAIGDRANRVALDVFEAVLRVNGTRDRRDRIEHAQVVSPQDIPRFGELKVIASMQPSHQTNDMRWAENRVGPERIKGAYAWNSLQKSGAVLAFGTDYDVEPINPFRGLYACVTREASEGGPAGGWEPQEKLPLDNCIRAYTVGSAYAEFADGKKGELKVGEYADFIVLSQDITKAAPRELLNTQVLQTVVGGRTVYQRK